MPRLHPATIAARREGRLVNVVATLRHQIVYSDAASFTVEAGQKDAYEAAERLIASGEAQAVDRWEAPVKTRKGPPRVKTYLKFRRAD